MLRRLVPVLQIIALSALVSACVKRIPASAGGDRKIVAGHDVVLGQPVEVPEGASVVWRMGDGAKMSGPQVRYAWHRPGDFDVTVKVTDPDGKQREDKARIEVLRPALLDVVPASIGFLMLFDRPGERLKDVPLFLERLLASGQDANTILASIREGLGFDPFSGEEWGKAGMDPEGGVALVGLDSGRDLAVVAALMPGDAARDTLRGMLFSTGDAKEQPSAKDMEIVEVRSLDSGELRAAYTFFRGYLWVAVPVEEGRDPVQALAKLRRAGLQAGLGSDGTYGKVSGLREQPGEIHLFMTGEFFRIQGQKGVAGESEEDRRRQDEILELLAYLRADLDVEADAVRAELRLGLSGQGARRLAGVLRARNPVPAFRGMLAGDRHLVAKLSADWAGLARALLEMSGEGPRWDELNGAMDEFARNSGIRLRQGIFDNLGDSLMLSLRLKMAGILGLAGRTGAGQKLADFVEGLLFVQLRDPDLFFSTLDGLCALESGLAGVVPVHRGDSKRWRVGPEELDLVLVPGSGMALLATSDEVAGAAQRRVSSPSEPGGGWPRSIEAAGSQVLAVDLARVIDDFDKTQPPEGNASAAVYKGLASMALAKLGKLDAFVLDAVLQNDVLTLSARLGLR